MSFDFSACATEGVRALHPYLPGKPISELEREYGVSDIVKLASNENLLGPAPAAREAIRRALDEVEFYPDSNAFDLKGLLAKRHGVDRSCLTLGNGSNDVLVLLAQVFAGPGDPVVFSQYAFAVYPIAAQMVNAKLVVAPALEQDASMPLGHDLDAMAARVEADTKLVFIANPNNPTGTWLDPMRLRRFLQQVPESTVVVVDEAYQEYTAGDEHPDVVEWIAEFPNLVVTRTFSKAFGLAGLRVGYAVSNPEIADLLNRVRQPFNVNAVALAGAEAALGDCDWLQHVCQVNDQGLLQLREAFARWGVSCLPSAANFILFDLGREAGPVYEALLRQAVIVRPVANYGLPRHLRVSIGDVQHNEAFIRAMDRVLAG